jgi:glycolate oxidase FAD binding subunit
LKLDSFGGTLLAMSAVAAISDFTPATQTELARYLEENARLERRALLPVGGRTALRYGAPSPRPVVTVDTAELNRVIDYPARDMTITVEAGIGIETLQKTLAAEGQRLPIDIPQIHRATLGGAIATNTSGPSRFGSGTFRDYVIGISAVDASGRLFSAGGRVVKNVAGYDICKLLVGSLGTLGIISQVTLKVRPIPESRRIVWTAFSDVRQVDAVLTGLLNSATRPAAIELMNPKSARHVVRESKLSLRIEQPILLVAYEGTARETAWQAETLRSELTSHGPVEMVTIDAEDAAAVWKPLTDYQAASDDPLTFQASLPPSRTVEFVEQATNQGIAIQAHAGSGVIIGHLPDRCATVESASITLRPLREFCEKHGGSLVVLACDETWHEKLSAFGKPRGDRELMERVRRQLDPQGLLNPGRMG